MTMDAATPFDPWNYRADTGWTPEDDLIGYHVKATDANIGKVELNSHITDDSYLLVDTGPWIFGSTIVVPAGTITHIDHTGRNVYLDRSKEQVSAAPVFETDYDHAADPAYREKLAEHYRDSYQAR